MARLQQILVAALLCATAARPTERRRLGADLDLVKLAKAAGDGELGSRVLFKVDGEHALAKSGDREALAKRVAADLDCDEHEPVRVFRPAGKHEAKHVAAGLHDWYAVKCSRAPEKAAAAKKTFDALTKFLDEADHDGVVVVEPELEHALSWTPDDPLLGTQPHYDAIRMPEAWDVVRGDASIVVQVLDTGIELDHPDLQLNIWTNPGEICGNGVDDDFNGYVDDCAFPRLDLFPPRPDEPHLPPRERALRRTRSSAAPLAQPGDPSHRAAAQVTATTTPTTRART